MIRTALLCLTLIVPAFAFGETPAPEQKFEFETYQLVILKRGPKAKDFTQAQLEALQKQHLAHLTKLGESGKMVIAGPFSEQADESFRGLCLYRVGSVAEAKALAESDPMVKAGRLVVEVMNWHVEKGYVQFPKAPAPKP